MKLKNLFAIAVVALALIGCTAQAADQLRVSGSQLFSTSQLATKDLTNSVTVTNYIYPAGKELSLTAQCQFNAASTSNLVVVLQPGDGVIWDTNVQKRIDLPGNGTTPTFTVTNFTINAVPAYRALIYTTSLTTARLTNAIITWSSK